KRRVYAEQGAREYYIYDPQGEMDPPFLGFASRYGRMEPLTPLASGGIMSPLLGAELRPMPMDETPRRPAGTWLRVINPASGRPVRVAEETHDAFLATESLITTMQEQLTAMQEHLNVETRTRIATQELLAISEERLAEETRARLAMEGRVARLETLMQGPRSDPTPDQGTKRRAERSSLCW
nr:hypothetical protein [Chloroflexota bacterium]